MFIECTINTLCKYVNLDPTPWVNNYFLFHITAGQYIIVYFYFSQANPARSAPPAFWQHPAVCRHPRRWCSGQRACPRLNCPQRVWSVSSMIFPLILKLLKVLTKRWLSVVHSLSASEEVVQLSTCLPVFSFVANRC